MSDTRASISKRRPNSMRVCPSRRRVRRSNCADNCWSSCRNKGSKLAAEERLLGSSEVLESVIGKFKYLAGERGQHGMTGMVLSIGAFVGRQAINTVQAAMEEITTPDVWNWCREHLGATVQSVRRRITQALAPEQKRKTLALENH